MAQFWQTTIRLIATLPGLCRPPSVRRISLVVLMGIFPGLFRVSRAQLLTTHRSWFNDIKSIPDSSTSDNKPRKISLRGSERLDSIELTLGSGQNYTHGGSGGTTHDLTLDNDEYWTKAQLCQSKHNDHTRIFYLLATTSAGNTVAAGRVTDDCKELDRKSVV